jgi:glycosyltransferase involved in cell wall biosynthesis
MPVPELSILLTAFNSELYIGETIKSILNQTFTDFELIIMDDGSTDQTVQIIQSFSDKRIQFVSHPLNMGIAATRNHCLELATGRYLAFVDSDDIIQPHKFEKQLAFLNSHPDFGLVGSYVILIDAQGRQTGKLNLSAGSEKIPAIMLFHNYFVNSAVTFRKSLLGNYSYTENLVPCEDYYMWNYLLQKSKGINLPEYLTSYRQHPASITHRNAGKKVESDKNLYKLIFQQVGIIPTEEESTIHLSLKNGDAIETLAQMKQTLNWLKKILQYSLKTPLIHERSIRPVILNRWLKVCFKARMKPFLIISGFIMILLNFNLFFNCRWQVKK